MPYYLHINPVRRSADSYYFWLSHNSGWNITLFYPLLKIDWDIRRFDFFDRDHPSKSLFQDFLTSIKINQYSNHSIVLDKNLNVDQIKLCTIILNVWKLKKFLQKTIVKLYSVLLTLSQVSNYCKIEMSVWWHIIHPIRKSQKYLEFFWLFKIFLQI